jgi:hypothetical protein
MLRNVFGGRLLPLDLLATLSRFAGKARAGSLYLFLGSLFWAAGQPGANPEPIALRSATLPFTPKEFYVADVVDSRADRSAVAYLFPATTPPGQSPGTRPVDLKGGGLAGIQQFIRESLPHNPNLRPVVIKLREFKLTESASAPGRVSGLAMVAMDFYLQRGEETVHLVEYRGGARYDRPANQLAVVEPTLRQSLAEALNYLNTWMDEEAPRNEKLAQGVKVFFHDHTRNLQDDTVFYSPDRPLSWDDFHGHPRLSRYAASIFPSFAYEGQSEVVNGYVHLNLNMKVYVLKSASWVKANARDQYGLNHEQRHFDIVKLVAERFKKKITPNNLTVEDYNSIVQYQYIESFREMNQLQEQYDNETRNGLDPMAQQRWNQRIEEELKALGVKK